MLTRRDLLVFGGLATAAIGLSACSSPGPEATMAHADVQRLDLPLHRTSGVDDVAEASARLAWELLVLGDEPNRVLAPSSLAITLGMVAEGATDDTLAAIDGVFGLGGDARSEALGALRQSLRIYDSLPESVDVDEPPDSPIVHQDSQVVILGDTEVGDRFLERLGRYYGAGTTHTSHEDAKSVLDAWAKEHTAGLIEESAIEVEPNLRLVLQDAILFAAAWRQPFESDDVALEFRSPGGGHQVDALGGTLTVPTASSDAWRAVRLHYDDALAMDVVLPAEGVSPTDLTAEQLEEARSALDAADAVELEVVMPPVDLTTKWDLLPLLEAQGITFDNSVDGIFPGAIVDAFAQQVRLQTSAEGTVGAALTEVAVVESAPMPPETEPFIVDRPFVMRVVDTATGWPLFLALVTDAEAAAG